MSTHTAMTPLEGHARAIVKTLLLEGPRSRTDLTASLELSAGSLTRLTKPLIDSGLIVEHPNVEQSGNIGRPSVPLSFNHAQFRFIGVKLTRTHAYVARTLADARIEELIASKLSSTAVKDCVALVAGMVSQLADNSPTPIHAMGVTLGGHVKDYRLVTRADHLNWDQVPLADLLEAATGITTVVENDIVAHTESTHWFGEGVGTETFALFTLGAGIGYGLITHGQVVSSDEAGYSLLSHYPLFSARIDDCASKLAEISPMPAPEVRNESNIVPATKSAFTGQCGHNACATAMLTIPALEARASHALGRPVTFTQLMGLAKAGDPAAQAVIDASGYALGTLFAAIANLTLPQRIVVGGEAVELATVADKAVLEGLHDHRDSRATDPELRFQDPDLALWTRGAAVVAMHNTLVGR